MDERYYNPYTFVLLYTSGLVAGLVSGLLGYGAGLVMIPAMLYINVSVKSASSTSAFNYFWLSLNNLFLLLSDRLLIDTETILWFTFLAFIGGSVVTILGHGVLKKYRISYMVVFIVVVLDILNMITGNIYFFILKSKFGFDSLIKFRSNC